MQETTKPRPFVFVLMPFSREFDDTYNLAIKPACENAGAYAERVDEQIFDGSILQRIYNQIAKADMIVSDLTGKNPNVFYETGYAHALGKRTILLIKIVDDIPFDFKHFPHIIYEGGLSGLKVDLEKKLKWHIENPGEKATTPDNLLVRANLIPLLSDANAITLITEFYGQKYLRVKIDTQNSANNELRPLDFQIGIISPSNFYYSSISSSSEPTNVIQLPDQQAIHLPNKEFHLRPAMWDSISLDLFSRGMIPTGDHRFVVRLYTESGYFDFPFTLRVKQD
jgi:hypothetical protein